MFEKKFFSCMVAIALIATISISAIATKTEAGPKGTATTGSVIPGQLGSLLLSTTTVTMFVNDTFFFSNVPYVTSPGQAGHGPIWDFSGTYTTGGGSTYIRWIYFHKSVSGTGTLVPPVGTWSVYTAQGPGTMTISILAEEPAWNFGPYALGTKTAQGTITVYVIALALDHFTISPTLGTQTAGVGFPITIVAYDQTGTYTSYAGTASLMSSIGSATPTQVGNFLAGIWTGSATTYKSGWQFLIVTGEGNRTGTSNLFPVLPGLLAKLGLIPWSITLSVDGTQSVALFGSDSWDNNIPDTQGSWATTIGASTILYGSATSFLAGTKSGRGTLTATSGTLTVGIPTIINPGTLTTIALSPATATLIVGGSQTFTATATDKHANEIVGLPYVWSVSNSIGSLTLIGGTPTGTARAVRLDATTPCAGTLSCSYGSITGQSWIEVLCTRLVGEYFKTPANQWDNAWYYIEIKNLGNILDSYLISIGQQAGWSSELRISPGSSGVTSATATLSAGSSTLLYLLVQRGSATSAGETCITSVIATSQTDSQITATATAMTVAGIHPMFNGGPLANGRSFYTGPTDPWQDWVKPGVYSGNSVITTDGTIVLGSGTAIVGINPDGSTKWSYNIGISGIKGLALDSDEKIVVTANRDVIRLNKNGSFDKRNTVLGSGAFYGNILVAGTKTVYTVNKTGNDFAPLEIRGIDLSESITTAWMYTAEGGNCPDSNNSNLLMSPNGDIYAGPAQTIYIFGPDGTLKKSIKIFKNIQGMAMDSERNRLFVTTMFCDVTSYDLSLNFIAENTTLRYDESDESRMNAGPILKKDGNVVVSIQKNLNGKDKIYLLNGQTLGKINSFSLGTRTGEWTNGVWNSPIIDNKQDNVYLATYDKNLLYVFNGSLTTVIATMTIGSNVTSTLVIGTDNSIYVVDSFGIRKIGRKKPIANLSISQIATQIAETNFGITIIAKSADGGTCTWFTGPNATATIGIDSGTITPTIAYFTNGVSTPNVSVTLAGTRTLYAIYGLIVGTSNSFVVQAGTTTAFNLNFTESPAYAMSSLPLYGSITVEPVDACGNPSIYNGTATLSDNLSGSVFPQIVFNNEGRKEIPGSQIIVGAIPSRDTWWIVNVQ